MQIETNIVRLRNHKPGCEACSLSRFCLAAGLSTEEMGVLGETTRQSRPLPRGHRMFRAGDALENLYLIKSGSMKTYHTTPDGLEQILRFHLPGDLIGLDAMGHDRHTSTAVTLETTSACMVPWAAIEGLTRRVPAVQRSLMRFIGNELANENDRVVLLGQRSARERLAAFLLHLSGQFHRRGFSATEFNLSMSRQEIANYLALAIETVSRLFTAFQSEGLLAIDRRFVRVLSLDALAGVSGTGARAAMSLG